MGYMDFTNQPADDAKFNSGLLLIYFLHNLKVEIAKSRMDKSVASYEHRLDLLTEFFMNLSTSMKPTKETDEIKKKHIEYWGKAKAAFALLKHLEATNRLKELKYSDVEIFDFWQLELYSLLQKQGMGMVKKGDVRFALGGVEDE